MKKSALILAAGVLVVSLLLQGKSAQNKQATPTVLSGASTKGAAATGVSEVVRLAEAFTATLGEEQRVLLQLAYSKTDAAKWSNFPQGATRPARVGIGWGTLTPLQLSAAKALMKYVLARDPANEGYDELEGILAADDYFGKTLGKSGMFGAGNFYLAFLGKPGTTTLWELQFGGHHLAVANTYNNGKLIGATPSFRGVEPATAVPADGRSYQPMAQEQEAFANIIAALTNPEKESARLSNTFTDVLVGPGKDGLFPTTKQGIPVGGLNSRQQQQILKAIALYVADLDAATAKQVMATYAAEIAATYVAYSGSGTMNQPNDYVRIDGPGVWIEYSAQPSRDFPGTTHPHSVWRDHKSDYGGH